MSGKIELLAPAGDLKKMKYAFAYGADAVYCGLPEFSLRAKTGFDLKSLSEAVKFARQNKKKIYFTFNIFAHNKQIDELKRCLAWLKKNQPDALIISDPGIINLITKELPKVNLHLSTQANTLNYESVAFWKKQGIKRIILGREVSLSDIKKITSRVKGIELEIFVHGAMCLSYSGRCYLSSYLAGRSANLGLCTQSCRWPYKIFLQDPTRPDQLLELDSDDKQTYILNSKDLCLYDFLPEIIASGLASIKIEGRTKSTYYLATVTRAYREAIDILSDKKLSDQIKSLRLKKIKNEFLKVENRGYTTGFFTGDKKIVKKMQNFTDVKTSGGWEFAGEIIKANGNRITARIHNLLSPKDQIEILQPQKIIKVMISDLRDQKGEPVDIARGGSEKTFTFNINKPKNINLGNFAILRKKR